MAKALSIIAILDVLSVGSIWMFSCLAVISSCSVSVALWFCLMLLDEMCCFQMSWLNFRVLMVASVFFVARGGGNIVVLLNLAMTCWWMGKARAELSSTGTVSVVSVLLTSSLKLGVFLGLAYLMAIASPSVLPFLVLGY